VILKSANHFKRFYDLLVKLEQMFADPPLPLSYVSALKGAEGLAAMTSLASSLPVVQSPASKALVEFATDFLGSIEESAKEIVLKRTIDRVRRFKEYLISAGVHLKLDDPRLTNELRTLREALDDDLAEQQVFFPSVSKWESITTMGGQYNFTLIHHNIPDAHYELIRAQFCYIADNDAACVYHSLNAAEYALRALATKLRVAKKQRDSWGTMIVSLRQKLEGKPGAKGLQKQKRSARRNAQIDYYSQLLDQCVFFNEHWRKKVAHMPPRYTAAEALNALTRAAEFVKLLAERSLKLPRQLPE
jgi:hypothetical protein